MNDKGIAYENGHRCYVMAPDGRTKRFLGCNHGDVPRAAIAHTVPVWVDPARSASGPSYPGSAAGLALRGGPLSEALELPPTRASAPRSPKYRAGAG